MEYIHDCSWSKKTQMIAILMKELTNGYPLTRSLQYFTLSIKQDPSSYNRRTHIPVTMVTFKIREMKHDTLTGQLQFLPWSVNICVFCGILTNFTLVYRYLAVKHSNKLDNTWNWKMHRYFSYNFPPRHSVKYHQLLPLYNTMVCNSYIPLSH